MRDTLETELAARLRDVAASVPDELAPPADLEERVARRRRRATHVPRLATFGIAAAIVGAIAIVSVVARAPDEGTIVSTSARGSAAVARLDNTAMLDARDAFVVALDANGHQVETLVTAVRGKVVYAQLTSDHRTLWYLSVAGRAGVDCGELVRADIASGASQIVGHAVAFGISADGARIAVSGRDECAPAPGARLAVRDLATNEFSTVGVAAVPTAISWSPDARRIVTSTCASTCEALRVFDVPQRLGAALRGQGLDAAGFAAFGSDGLYVVERNLVMRFEGAALRDDTTVLSDESRDLLQVVPTASGTVVVARPRGAPSSEPPGLFRIEGGVLHPVRAPFAFGALSPVPGPR